MGAYHVDVVAVNVMVFCFSGRAASMEIAFSQGARG
jgi:hypothetical protein